MRANLSCLLVFGALAGAVSAASEISGVGRAIDGDTLEISGIPIRLYGVDAPEMGQTCGDAAGAAWECGAAAKSRLAALIGAGALRCAPVTSDNFGRIVADCSAGGVGVNARIVADGLAWAYLRDTEAFLQDESAARAAGRGVWQGEFQTAADWRAAGEWRAASGEIAPSGCVVKGAVTSEGARVYAMPGDAAYDRIEIDLAAGDRWFCDTGDAEAAGWRAVGGGR